MTTPTPELKDQIAWLTGPEAEAVFKAAWHKADREKRPGQRVASGLKAVAERMREVDPR